MRSATIFASALAFAASAFAADPTEGYAVVLSPTEGQNVPAGKDFTIKWDAGKYSGPAGISLLAGTDPAHLQVVDTIATGGVEVKDGAYSWPVDCTLGEAKTYGIKIFSVADGGATFQYSFPFHIKGPSCGGDDNSSTTTSTSASTSVPVTSSGYPVQSPTKSSSSAAETTSTSTSTSSVKSYPVQSTSSTLVTVVTTTAITTANSYPATTQAPTTTAPTTTPTVTPTSSPVPTGGAARVGAGVAFGLAAMAFAL